MQIRGERWKTKFSESPRFPHVRKDIQITTAISPLFIFILWIQQMASSISSCDNCSVKWSALSSGEAGAVWGSSWGYVSQADAAYRKDAWDRCWRVSVRRLGEVKTFYPVLIRGLNCDLGTWDPKDKLWSTEYTWVPRKLTYLFWHCGIRLSSFIATYYVIFLGFQCYWGLTKIWASAGYWHSLYLPLLCVFSPQFFLSIIHGRNNYMHAFCSIYVFLSIHSSNHSCVLHHAIEFNLIKLVFFFFFFNNLERRGFSRNEFELCKYYYVKNFRTQTEVYVNLALVFKYNMLCPILFLFLACPA